MSAGKICTRVIATATPRETIREAARRMEDNEVGTLIVLDAEGRASGILTDRDIALRCVAANLDPDSTVISKLMTKPVHTVNERTPIEEALSRMASWGTRRLAVTDDQQHLVGVLALDDVLELLFEETEAIGRLLSKQRSVLNP